MVLTVQDAIGRVELITVQPLLRLINSRKIAFARSNDSHVVISSA